MARKTRAQRIELTVWEAAILAMMLQREIRLGGTNEYQAKCRAFLRKVKAPIRLVA